MWRSKGWKQPDGIGSKTPEMAFEAGADAILEALGGEHIEKDKYYCSPCGACSSDEDCRASESGRLVFIPEDE